MVMYPTVLATGFISLPTITAQYAKNDLWLVCIFAALAGFVVIYAADRLHEWHPKQSIIQYSEQIIGKIPGKIVGIIFFLNLMYSIGTIVRQYAEFVTGSFLFKTPMLVVLSSMMMLCVFAVRGGVEMVARSAVILTPIFILPLLLLLFLVPDLDIGHIFPVLSRGWIPVMKGTVSIQAVVAEMFLITFLLPCLTDPENGRKWSLISLVAIMASMIFVNLFALFLFGPDTGNKTFVIFSAFRDISVGDFFENLEALLLVMWVAGSFVKLSMFLYAAVLSFGQCFGLSDTRSFVFPLGILSVLFSVWGIPDFTHLGEYLRLIGPFQLPMYLLVIPLLLLLTEAVRRKVRSRAGANQDT